MSGEGPQMAMLHRLRGYALAQNGDLDGGWAALEQSFQVARTRQADFELALTLGAMARLARLRGDADAGEYDAESQSLLRRLDVVIVPHIPLGT
jgi:hypothetical protein